MLVRSGRYISRCISTFIVVGMLISALGACSQSSSSSNVVKIGVTAPMTGDFSSDGVALKQGYVLWAEAVNKRGGLLGRQVQMDIEDDQSKPEKASTLYNNMVSNHDDLLFASFTDALTLAGANVAQRNGYAFLEGAGTSPSTFHENHVPNLFSVSLSASEYLTSFTSYIRSLPRAANQKPLSIAYLTSDDTFTKPQIDHAKSIFDAAHLPSAYYKVYPAETTDYTGIAQSLVAAKPDVVILGTLGTTDCVAFMKYFKQQNFNPMAIVATSGPDQGDQFTGPLGGAQYARDVFVPNDGWFPGIANYQSDQFIKDYVAKYGGTATDISSDTVQAYSVGQVMEQAVIKANSLDNAKIITTLKNNSFNTLQGPVKFAPDGENSTATAFLFQWQNGQLIPVFPANEAKNNPELQHYFGLTPPASS